MSRTTSRLRGERGPGRAALLLAALAVGAPASHLPAQVLEGRVLRADSMAVAGALVELHRITPDSGSVIDSTRTGQGGAFRFVTDLAGDSGAVYLPGARHDGILYWGPALHGGGVVPDRGAEPFVITVYDTVAVSGPVEDLTVGMRHAVLTPGRGGVQVDEIIDVKGRDIRTLVSAADTGPVWRTALARDAHGAIPNAAEVSPRDLRLRNDRLELLGMLPPFGARLGVSYFVQGSDFDLRLEHDTDRIEILVVDVPGLEVTATGVAPAPAIGVETGAAMRRYTATHLRSGTNLRLTLTLSEDGPAAAWPWLVAALVLGLAALAARRHVGRVA